MFVKIKSPVWLETCHHCPSGCTTSTTDYVLVRRASPL